MSRQIDFLSGQLLSLHHMLDQEARTMHFDTPQADLLKSYAELVAEKVLVNGQLCNDTFDQRSHLPEGAASSSTLQPHLLATEAILRSQVCLMVTESMFFMYDCKAIQAFLVVKLISQTVRNFSFGNSSY